MQTRISKIFRGTNPRTLATGSALEHYEEGRQLSNAGPVITVSLPNFHLTSTWQFIIFTIIKLYHTPTIHHSLIALLFQTQKLACSTNISRIDCCYLTHRSWLSDFFFKFQYCVKCISISWILTYILSRTVWKISQIGGKIFAFDRAGILLLNTLVWDES